ncbi:MAG: DUF402 domain-containing protein [Lachnospiraceae bacterium]|nr:DUF402 domain-containing protein [Lachnospiraceae bacterium]
MSEKILLFRRRFIPNELTFLKDDELIAYNDEKIVTRWNSLKPRPDFSGGFSTYYRKKGLKISKIIDNDGKFLHWYCDIVLECGPEALDVDHDCKLRNGADQFILSGNRSGFVPIVYQDLLIDIIVNPNGLIEVADMDELADAQKAGLITPEMTDKALRTAESYLHLLYSRYGRIDCSDERFVIPN